MTNLHPLGRPHFAPRQRLGKGEWRYEIRQCSEGRQCDRPHILWQRVFWQCFEVYNVESTLPPPQKKGRPSGLGWMIEGPKTGSAHYHFCLAGVAHFSTLGHPRPFLVCHWPLHEPLAPSSCLPEFGPGFFLMSDPKFNLVWCFYVWGYIYVCFLLKKNILLCCVEKEET